MIEFKNVQKIYRKGQVAIKNASFKVNKGEFVFFIGPSGAGKSTLLKMVNKVEKPTEGSVLVFSRDVKKIKTKILRQNVGVVFQDFKLLNKKTAYENVAYVLESLGKNPFKIKESVMEALEKLGIGQYAKKYPDEMSGGEVQRLAIARAIITKPEILICDEPTGNLDTENANIVMYYLNQLNKEGSTILMSTHNKDIVEKEKKRIIKIENGIVSDLGKEGNITL